jgi:hypothetical protein
MTDMADESLVNMECDANWVTGLSAAPSVREKRKVKFGDKNIWFGGESVVGRKGDDGEWMEVGCSVM